MEEQRGTGWNEPDSLAQQALDLAEENKRLKQREGDQPLPTQNDHRDVQSQVIEDIKERREVGIKRYGTPLQPNNGRDALQDAYEEAIDLCMYLKQMIIERELRETRAE